MLQDDQVRFFGQPVAVVVAETLDQAEHAALAVRVDYEARTPATRIEDAETLAPSDADSARGDADAALLQAPVTIDATYGIARENHNPMELHATVAAWDGDHLTLWSTSQFVVGGFGSALRTWPHVTLAALAARAVRRPVKLVPDPSPDVLYDGSSAAHRAADRVGRRA